MSHAQTLQITARLGNCSRAGRWLYEAAEMAEAIGSESEENPILQQFILTDFHCSYDRSD
ncbi:hypothetical protein N7508_000393 [Penicillium antarcticum]|uniref:uncharacterized protein n=1 Tax=Penicillium antarcticum TaxID=416450 RepID=UPI0023920248|nr:uncharacterized protein N7508_000393 [Penicillium antarcticum]KAJ5320110.1 hypothetical protein N7508_000393 [Penicillium antarcticum]